LEPDVDTGFLLQDMLGWTRGEATCIVDVGQGVTVTYGELRRRVSLLAGCLRDVGATRGSRVAVYLPNGWAFATALYAVLTCGSIGVPIDYRSTDREIEFYVKNSGCSLLIHSGEKTPKQIQNVVYFNIDDLEFNGHSHQNMAVPAPMEQSNNSADADACIFYTGGTTGTPKGVVLTHRNIIWVLRGLFKAWDLQRGGEVFAQVLPMSHSGGLNCCFNTSLYSGSTCIILKKFRADALLDSIEKFRVTVLVAVPTVYGELVKALGSSHWDLGSLRVCFSSGAAISERVVREFRKLTGVLINVGWGLTEASPQLTVAPLGVFKPNYVGVPLDGTEVAAFEGERRLPLNAVGELGARGPQIMRGYWNNAEDTKAVFNQDGFLLTGDIGYIAEDGVYLLGRRKNLINTGGYKVWPHEVEEVIMENPHVREVAVVGAPDDKYGEIVKAYVVADGEIDEKTLRDFCKERLAGYKVPRVIEFRSSLPKSSVGKILHRLLKDSSSDTKEF
jgi:long-chain acyl-CoA synthetase